MLISFYLSNYLSFRDGYTLHMDASANRSKIFNENVIQKIPSGEKSKNKYILNSSVLYGSNAGGKTNFISGINALQNIVKHTFNEEYKLKRYIIPFAFTEKEEPTTFKIEMLKEVSGQSYKFRYLVSIFNGEIYKEELNYSKILKTKLSKSKVLFNRKQDDIQNFSPSLKKLINQFKTRNIKEKSLLSLLINDINQTYFEDQINTIDYKMLQTVYDFITKDLVLSRNMDDNEIAKHINEKSFKKKVILALKDIDIEIQDFNIIDVTDFYINSIKNDKNIPEEVYKEMLETVRNKKKFLIETVRKINNTEYTLPFVHESLGTIKFIEDFIEIIDCIENGKVYIVDEIENHFHPKVQRYILNQFLRENSNGAQIVFATHNTDFLEYKIFSKEQVWFIDKNRDTRESELYRMADFEEVSYENHNWRNLYREGRLGATPKVIY